MLINELLLSTNCFSDIMQGVLVTYANFCDLLQ